MKHTQFNSYEGLLTLYSVVFPLQILSIKIIIKIKTLKQTQSGLIQLSCLPLPTPVSQLKETGRVGSCLLVAPDYRMSSTG